MSKSKVKYEAKDCAFAEREINNKATMRVLRVGMVYLTEFIINDLVIAFRSRFGSSIGKWEISSEQEVPAEYTIAYLESLCEKEQELIDAFDTANDSCDPAGN